MSNDTDIPSWLTDAESLATAVTPTSSAVTAVANLLTEGLKLSAPLITDDETHKYDNQVTSRLQELVKILSQVDGDPRADNLSRYFTQLCIDAGTPALGLGSDISVPVAFVLALATAALNSIRDRAVLTQITATASQSQGAK